MIRHKEQKSTLKHYLVDLSGVNARIVQELTRLIGDNALVLTLVLTITRHTYACSQF
jgi:hypothetical protein